MIWACGIEPLFGAKRGRGERPEFRGWKVRVTSAGDARGSSGRAPDGETSDAGLVGDPEAAAVALSGQGSGDRRRVVVVRGLSGLLGVVGVEAEDVIGDPLRFGRRMENLAAVLLKHVDP